MDIKNYFLKRKQEKAIIKTDGYNCFCSLPYKCPKCVWATDTLKAYVTHLENHLS